MIMGIYKLRPIRSKAGWGSIFDTSNFLQSFQKKTQVSNAALRSIRTKTERALQDTSRMNCSLWQCSLCAVIRSRTWLGHLEQIVMFEEVSELPENCFCKSSERKWRFLIESNATRTQWTVSRVTERLHSSALTVLCWPPPRFQQCLSQ